MPDGPIDTGLSSPKRKRDVVFGPGPARGGDPPAGVAPDGVREPGCRGLEGEETVPMNG